MFVCVLWKFVDAAAKVVDDFICFHNAYFENIFYFLLS